MMSEVAGTVCLDQVVIGLCKCCLKNNVVCSCRLKLFIGSVMSAVCSTPQLQLSVSFMSRVLCCVGLKHPVITGSMTCN